MANNILDGKRVLVTGGTGTLGHAIMKRATAENWDTEFTIFSRDPIKQQHMKKLYPHARYVMGDVRNYDSLYYTALGMDCILHLAAMKHIPQAEENPGECVSINVDGVRNVTMAAMQAGVKQVAFVSTDKVCNAINTYGASKKIGESLILEANRHGLTQFHICRYGNVIGSNGSVLQVWQRQLEQGIKPTITHPDMTRFWLTESQAVDLVLLALSNSPGTITVPLAPALSMKDFATYLLGDVELETIGLRAGEKMHECLLTTEEVVSARFCGSIPSVSGEVECVVIGGGNKTTSIARDYTSEDPRHWLMADELRAMAGVE